MKRVILFLIGVLIFLFSMTNISAVTYVQGNDIDLKHPVRIDGFPSSSIDCNISVFDPNFNVIIDYKEMTNDYDVHNYTLNSSQTDKLGKYIYDITCTTGRSNQTESFSFDITGSGFEFNEPRSIYSVAMLALLIFFLVGDLYYTFRLPNGNDTDDYGYIISINKLKYLKVVLVFVAWSLVLTILFTASNISLAYLGSEMFGQLFFVLYKIMMLLTYPGIIIFFIFIFVQIFKDMKVKRMIERGIEVQGSI